MSEKVPAQLSSPGLSSVYLIVMGNCRWVNVGVFVLVDLRPGRIEKSPFIDLVSPG